MRGKSHHVQNISFLSHKPHSQRNKNTNKDDNTQHTSLNHHNVTQRSHQPDHLQPQNEAATSKLDLIFRKQPKQIQEKLMKLLIHYNALMQYNTQTNMFEVDLLLPFVNEAEKGNFVRQFMAIRKGSPLNQVYSQTQGQTHKARSESEAAETRKFSFNNMSMNDGPSGEYGRNEDVSYMDNNLNSNNSHNHNAHDDHSANKTVDPIASLARNGTGSSNRNANSNYQTNNHSNSNNSNAGHNMDINSHLNSSANVIHHIHNTHSNPSSNAASNVNARRQINYSSTPSNNQRQSSQLYSSPDYPQRHQQEDQNQQISSSNNKNQPIKTQQQQYQAKHHHETANIDHKNSHLKIDYNKLKQTIAAKLNKALNQLKAQSESNIKQTQSKPIFIFQEEQAQPKFQQKQQAKQQQSFIHQLSTNSFNHTHKSTDSKPLAASQYIRQDIDDHQPLFQDGKYHQPTQNMSDHFNSHYHKFQETIFQQQEQEQQDIEPLFDDHHRKYQSNKKNATSFQEYTKKYTTVRQNQNQPRPNPPTNSRNDRHKNNNVRVATKDSENGHETRYWSSKQKAYGDHNEVIAERNRGKRSEQGQKGKVRFEAVAYKSKERTNDHQQHTPPQTTNIRDKHRPNLRQSNTKKAVTNQNVSQFLSAHKKNLDKIYVEIQSKINQRQVLPLNKSSSRQRQKQKVVIEQDENVIQDLFILVMDEQEGEGDAKGGQFKAQILQDYSRQIVVNNRTLSSEDLRKYFKYLHFHAKKLYLKYMNHKQK